MVRRRTPKEYEKAREYFGISASVLAVKLWPLFDEFDEGKMTSARLCEEFMVALMKFKMKKRGVK